MSINEILERALERLVAWVVKRPRLALWACLAVVALLTAGMPRLYIDVTNESLFRPGDPALEQYQRFQAQFGRDDMVIAAIESPKIFTPEFLTKLEAYHRDLEKSVPYLDLVTSLVNVTSVTDQRGEVLINDLRNVWPKRQEDFPAFRKAIIENPLYRNLIISEDGNTTAVVVRPSAFATEAAQGSFRNTVINWHDRLRAYLEGRELPETPQATAADDVSKFTGDLTATAEIAGATKPLTTRQLEDFVAAVRQVTKKHQADDFSVRLGGGSLIAVEHAESIHADFARLIPIVFLFVFVVLYIVLLRLSAVFLPLAVLMLTIFATLGLMGWLGWPITPVIVALPPLILTACVGQSVHMLTSYFEYQNRSGDVGVSLLHAVRHSGVPIVFTSLTTAAGFMSFVTADIKPIGDFGILVAFGSLLALLLTLVLNPAILCLVRNPEKNAAYSRRWQLHVDWIWKIADWSFQRPVKIATAMVIVMALLVPGVTQLKFSHDTLRWFPENEPVRVNTLALDAIFHGSIPLEVVIDTGKANGIYSPEFMRRLEALQSYAESLKASKIEMGRATSVVDTLKRIHAVMNSEKPATAIPGDDKLIAQELLLFESSGAEDVEKLIDSRFSMVRLTARMSWADAVDYLPVRTAMEAKTKELFAGTATVTVTGTVDLVGRALVGIIQSMTSSYLIAVIAIALMMAAVLRSWSFGLVAMVPNLFPIFMSLGVMGYVGMPLDMFTVLFGGIALGLAVDDTTHFMHGYRHRRRDLGLPMRESLQQVVALAGPASLFNTVAMTLGFFVFLFSKMDALASFGLLLGITILCAWVAEIFVSPALIHLYERLTQGRALSKESLAGSPAFQKSE